MTATAVVQPDHTGTGTTVSGRPSPLRSSPPDAPGPARILPPALDHRFWRLFAAATTSSVGDGLAVVAFPLLAAARTDRPAAIAAVAIAQRLPWLLFGLVGGAVADRLHRGRTMAVVDLCRAAIVLVLAGLALTGGLSLPLLYAGAFVLASFETVFTAAAHAALPLLVDERALDRANGYLWATQMGGEQLVGPAVGGALFATSAALPLGLDALTFVGSALLVATLCRSLPSPPVAPGSTDARSMRHDVLEGVRFFWHHDVLRALTLLVGGFAFFQAMTAAVLVIYALDVLGLSEAGYGAFLGATAIGNVLGALLASPIRSRMAATPVLAVAGVGAAIAYLGVALTRAPAVAALLLGIEAVAVACGTVVSLSLRQAAVPDALRGRVGNAFRSCLWGVIPLGALVGGGLATVADVRAAYVVAGLAQLALVAVVAPRLSRADAGVQGWARARRGRR